MSYPDRYKLLRRERARQDLRSAVWYLVVALAALALACWFSSMPVFGQVLRVDGGTGAAVRINGETNWVLSCQHGNVRVGEVFQIQDEAGHVVSGQVVAIGDNNADCALIRTDRPAARFFDLADGDPAPGEQVTLCGYTMGGPKQCKVGRVTGYSALVGEAQGYTNYGDSGGPMLNTSGKLCGILSGNPGGPMIYCRLYCIKRMLDRVFPNRPARIIGHAPRPSVYVRPPQATQPAPQQSPQPGYDDPWQSSGNPSQGGGTYAGGAQGPVLSLDSEEAKVPEAVVAAAPAFDPEWGAQVDRDLDALASGKQDKGEYVLQGQYDAVQKEIGTDYTNLTTRTNDLETAVNAEDGLIATRIKQNVDALLGEVNDLADKKIEKAIGPIDTKLGEIKQSLVVTVAGHAAQMFGINLPPTLLAAGSLIGGYGLPVALAGYGLYRWWKGRKQTSTSPGAGGAGQPGSFRSQ